MPFRVSGRNLDIGEALRNRMNARVAEAMAKYFDGGYSGHVTVGKEGFGFRTECDVHLDSGITLHTDGMAADAYASADQAALRIEKRLRRYKRRLKGRATARTDTSANELNVDALSYVIAAPDHETEEEVAAFSPVIIAEFDDHAGAIVSERGRARARHDGRARRGVPSLRDRTGEHRLPPRRRQCRLGRPARRQRAGVSSLPLRRVMPRESGASSNHWRPLYWIARFRGQ